MEEVMKAGFEWKTLRAIEGLFLEFNRKKPKVWPEIKDHSKAISTFFRFLNIIINNNETFLEILYG